MFEQVSSDDGHLMSLAGLGLGGSPYPMSGGGWGRGWMGAVQ